ncbi:MAG: hypothetical protein M3R27_09130 [Bacteroidota bacterium]|nr:hypothetical protein [Bacteroidota bacterium]
MKTLLTFGFRAILLLTTISLLSGCFMFRKKNKCGDCPKWKLELNNYFQK